MGKLDLSKFKKVRSGEKHTVLRHPEGHEITIFHKSLSKPIREQLDKLPHYDQGGTVTGGQSRLAKGIKNTAQGSNPGINPNVATSIGSAFGGSHAEGGVIKKDNSPTPTPTSTPTPTPDPNIDPNKAKSTQDSMRKAFHFAEGTGSVEGEETPVMASKLESQYVPEEEDAQTVVDASPSMQIADEAAPMTPPDAHTHLSEALKNLSQKFIPQAPEAKSAPIGVSEPQPNQVQAPTSAPQGSLVNQAKADTELANQAEMASAGNTQAAMAQNAQTYGKQAEDMQALHAKYEDIGNQLHTKFEDLSQQVSAGHIDPNHWWNSQSTGSKILTSIGMLFAGAGAGVSGHPEMVSNILNKTIDRDIDAQKADLNNKHTLLGKYMEMYNSLPQAEAAARLTMNAGIEGLINQQASKLGSANAMNTATMAIAARRQQLLPQMEGLAKGQMMSQMYGDMNKPQAQSSDAETAYQNQMQKMRILNPDLGKDMENKYLPNVGIARVPINDSLREKMAAQKDLSTKLARLEVFAKQHQGTTLDRETVNIGHTLAADAQQAARVAGHQGVYKESDQKFLENMIDSDPTKFMASVRTIPKYKTLREQNDATLKTLYKSYGVKPFSGSNEPQSGGQNNAAMEWLKANPNDPRAAAVRQKLGM